MSEPRRGRIVIALDPLDAKDVAVEIARHLRRESAQELLGLLIEDTYLLNHARSRLAREIMLSGAERPLSGNVLERQMRAQSTQIRRRFEAAAAAMGAQASFRVARGELLAELGEQARGAEAVVLSLRRAPTRLDDLLEAAIDRFAAAHLPLLLLAREGWLKGRSILVVVADWDADAAALGLGARIAATSGSSLNIVVTRDALAGSDDWTAEGVARLAGLPVPLGDITPMVRLDAAALARAARASEARLLVLPSGPHADRALVAALSRGLTSALMLVRSLRREPEGPPS